MQHAQAEPIESADQPGENPPDSRKPYATPAIIHELHLETRAGSPIGLTNILKPFDPRARI